MRGNHPSFIVAERYEATRKVGQRALKLWSLIEESLNKKY